MRALLSGQARGCRRLLAHVFYRRRLPAARRRDLPLPRLSQPEREGEGLRPANAQKHQTESSGCRRPAPTGCWPMGATSIGGIRWSRAIPRPCTRPGSRCADGSAASEDEVEDDDLEDRIVSWPVRMPKAARKPPNPAERAVARVLQKIVFCRAPLRREISPSSRRDRVLHGRGAFLPATFTDPDGGARSCRLQRAHRRMTTAHSATLPWRPFPA